jgi:hypothetical protein
LRIARDRYAVARIAVGAERPDGIDHGDSGECRVPGQQAAPHNMVDYQHGADSRPADQSDYLPATDISLQFSSNIAAKANIQA